MQKNIKIGSKVVFAIVAIMLLFKVYQLAVTEQVKSEGKDVKVFEVSQEDIISSGQEIIVKSFDEITEVKWVNNNQLYIDGIIDGASSTFIFDLENNELVYADQITQSSVDYGKYEFIQEIPGYGVLASNGSELGLLNDGEYFVIADNATFDDELKFTLSRDLTKLLYYHHDKETIVTYNFEKNFYRTINISLDRKMLESFEEVIQISPIGGYVSVEHRAELDDTYFSIYGADSGRLYADEVYGMNLSWSDSDEYVAYYYTKESQLQAHGISDMTITSNRIGYYDVAGKAIDFIESSKSDRLHLSKLYWSGQKVTVLNGSIDETIMINQISSYDFDSHIFQEWDIELEPFEIGSKLEFLEYEDAYIVTASSNDNHHAYRILKDSKEVIAYEDLKPFTLIDEKETYFYTQDGAFVSLDHDKMTIAKDGYQGYMNLTESSFKAIPSDTMAYMAIWLTGKSEIRILEID